MKARPTRRARAAALIALATVLTTTGCGTPAPGVAGTDGTTTVTRSEVDEVAKDFKQVPAQQRPSKQNILQLMLLRPRILDEAKKNRVPVRGLDEIRPVISKQLPNVSDRTLELFQADAAFSTLPPEVQKKVVEAANSDDLQIDPRFRGDMPNWIQPRELEDVMPGQMPGEAPQGQVPPDQVDPQQQVPQDQVPPQQDPQQQAPAPSGH